ncbi:hypothetical protein MIND_01106300 [Mycena indigotica]|uniref:Uncharacterized protein n=1 Tax=Mycena indigotica TaxID=2126181 RepID=A0A8H6SBF4_9AGAR|nr:uncharacterized protein MIND_01106300 [Mycena indigotica]KAF7295661.1 hypothetical protein MIND_01106300 [Mycena indigotica]
MSFSDTGLSILLSRDTHNSSDTDPPSTSRKALIDTFVTLQLLGLVGSIALVLTTTLSRRAPRNATWQNFFTSWIISTASYSLLLVSGQLYKEHPPFGLCLAQAGLIYGTPSLTAATTFGLIMQIWFSVQNLLLRKVKHERLWTVVILVLPYCMMFGMVIASWVTGIQNPSRVKVIGSGMYCHIGPSSTLGKASAALVALTLLPTIALEITICVALRKNWSTFKRMRHSMSITLRVMIFTLFGILAISLSGVFVFSDSHGAAINVILAALPVIGVIIFASQTDILSVWRITRQRPEGAQPLQSQVSETTSTSKPLPDLPPGAV